MGTCGLLSASAQLVHLLGRSPAVNVLNNVDRIGFCRRFLLWVRCRLTTWTGFDDFVLRPASNEKFIRKYLTSSIFPSCVLFVFGLPSVTLAAHYIHIDMLRLVFVSLTIRPTVMLLGMLSIALELSPTISGLFNLYPSNNLFPRFRILWQVPTSVTSYHPPMTRTKVV